MTKNVIWTKSVLDKLRAFRSSRFTLDESYGFVAQLIIETENLLTTPALTKTYIEETGKYKGYSRIVIRRFKIYFRSTDHQIIIIAVLIPRTSLNSPNPFPDQSNHLFYTIPFSSHHKLRPFHKY